MKRTFAIALFAYAFVACLPNPQSVKERRETFDRDSLKGSLIFDSSPSDMVPVGAEFAKLLYDLGGYKNMATALPTPARFRSRGPQMFGSPKIAS